MLLYGCLSFSSQFRRPLRILKAALNTRQISDMGANTLLRYLFFVGKRFLYEPRGKTMYETHVVIRKKGFKLNVVIFDTWT